MITDQMCRTKNDSETRLYFTKNENRDFSGFMEHVAEEKVWRFEDIVMMLALHERLFMTLNYPEAACELRMIEKPGRIKKELYEMTIDRNEMPVDSKPTFIINVLYRQNASWQGTIQWVEGGVEKKFRSALEMIRIMDSVVNEQEEHWQ